MKYNTGQKIGDFTIMKHENSRYFLECSCGNKSRGKTDFIDSKVKILEEKGFVACMSCTYAKRRIKSKLNFYGPAFIRIKSSARHRGIDFDLDLQDAVEIFEQDCTYCGAPPSNKILWSKKFDSYVTYQGLDRIDSAKGYEKGNIVPCCKTCNTMKLALSTEDFYLQIQRIYLKKFNDYSERK